MAQDPGPNELERLLAAAADDPAARPAFARAILDADVYVLGSVETDDGTVVPGNRVKVQRFTDSDGWTTPFFSSQEAVQRFRAARPDADPNQIRLQGRDVFLMAKDDRLTLNPGSPYGKTYLPAEIQAMLAGREPGRTTVQMSQPQTVRTGAAAHIPPHLLEVLTRYLAQRPVVEAARFGWIAYPDQQEGYLLVLTTADREAALDGFGALQINQLTGGTVLDVLCENPGEEPRLLGGVPAFYVRRPQSDVQADGPSPPDPKGASGERRRWFKRG